MKIVLVIYPSVSNTPVELKYVPRKGEKVYFKTNLYQVEDVYYNIDERVIKILVR